MPHAVKGFYHLTLIFPSTKANCLVIVILSKHVIVFAHLEGNFLNQFLPYSMHFEIFPHPRMRLNLVNSEPFRLVVAYHHANKVFKILGDLWWICMVSRGFSLNFFPKDVVTVLDYVFVHRIVLRGSGNEFHVESHFEHCDSDCEYVHFSPIILVDFLLL